MAANPDDAIALIARLCLLPGNATYVDDVIGNLKAIGIDRAVAERDSPALYAWLIDGFSYQGISDSAADTYIERHGSADWRQIGQAVADPAAQCPKLAGFEAYRGCRYQKTRHTCGNLDCFPTCPVPSFPLRKGSLNEQAFSLFLFLRDRCGGDLVGFIDATIATGSDEPDPIADGRAALLRSFGEIQGVSNKLISMMLSDLLIGADPSRPAWAGVGQSMVAIDSLVHNFLHRTGILAVHGASHSYGPKCVGPHGCEAVIRSLAERFEAQSVNPSYPSAFPRLVQHAIWRFCAARQLNICNGKNIPSDRRCECLSCPLWGRCARLPLRHPSHGEGR